jgi:catechol 2,3-dioxygenase-like lactoylglutathione lyase family enzyme
MSANTHFFAGVPVSDLDAGVDWYTRFFGRPRDRRVGENGVRHVDVPDPDGNRIAFAEPPG